MILHNSTPSIYLPRGKPGLKFFIDTRNPLGNDTLLPDNSSVSQLYDLTTHISVTQANGSKQPLFLQNQVNHISALNFDGTVQSLQVAGLDTVMGSGDLTLFFVVNVTATGTRWLLDTNSGGNRLILTISGYDASGGRTATGTAVTGLQILSYRFDATALTGEVHRNGNLLANGAYVGRAFGATTGLFADSGATFARFKGQSFAIPAYTFKLPDADYFDIIRSYGNILGIATV